MAACIAFLSARPGSSMKCVLPFEQLPEFSFLRSWGPCGATEHPSKRSQSVVMRRRSHNRPTDAWLATAACPPGGMFHWDVLNRMASLGLAGPSWAMHCVDNQIHGEIRRAGALGGPGQFRPSGGRLARARAWRCRIGWALVLLWHPQADSKRPPRHLGAAARAALSYHVHQPLAHACAHKAHA